MLLDPPVAAQVGPLLRSASRVRRGGRVTVMAAQLAGPTAALTVVGPRGYVREMPVAVQNGLAGATFRLPRYAGRYRIGIVDLSPVCSQAPALVAATCLRARR